jgi:hypothetical protein
MISFFKDPKYVKAADGALGVYCMWVEEYSKTTCKDLISGYTTDYLANAFTATSVMQGPYICGNALPFCSAVPTLEISDWKTLHLADKPAGNANNDAIDNIYMNVMSGGSRPSYNILHISDLNIDYNYVPGTKADCEDLICCQAKHGTSGGNLA